LPRPGQLVRYNNAVPGVLTVNPASSTNDHCADSFFEHEFDTGVLKPGQVFSHAFNTAGEYFYNDCVWPHITGKIVVQ